MTRKLRRDLMRRKFSLIILALTGAVGVGAFVGYAAVYRDLDAARHDYYASNRLADFSAGLKRAPEWAVEDVAALENVRAVEGRVAMPILLNLPKREQPVSGMAISYPLDRRPRFNDLLISSGMRFSRADAREVIVDDQFAKATGLRAGSRLSVVLFGEQHEFLIIGTAMSPEYIYLIPPGGDIFPDPSNYGVIYLPLPFMQEKCDLDGAYNQIVGGVHDRSRAALTNTLKLIEEDLDAYGVLLTTPYWEEASVKILADELQQLQVSAILVPLLFLGVSALVLNILIGRMVRQQRTVIGTLRALGYTRNSIMRHYLGYGLLLGMLSGLAGLAFGRWIQVQTLSLYSVFFAIPGIHPRYHIDLLIVGFGISLVAAVSGTLKGVYFAARLEPAEAMRPPPPEKGGRILPERITFLWKAISFRWKIILRAVFRNPFRSSVSVLSGTIATALIFMMFGMMDGLNYMIEHEFDRVSHQDYTVSLREPRGMPAQLDFRNLGPVSITEPQLGVACYFSRGSMRRLVGVIGLPRNGRLFTPLDNEGNPVIIPEKGIVLPRKLAEILEVETGETLVMRLLVARRSSVTVPVTAIADTYIGLAAFADIEYLSRLLGEEYAVNAVLCNLFTGASDKAFVAELKKMPAVIGIGERRRSLTRFNESFGGMMKTSMAILIMFAGLIAFGSVLNTALVSLSERQIEVGTLRVLGYTTRQVAGIFSGESFFLNAVGIIVGIFVGFGFNVMISAQYNTELYRFPVVVKFSSIVLSAAFMILFVSLAQIVVYRMVRSLKWLDVLKTRE